MISRWEFHDSMWWFADGNFMSGELLWGHFPLWTLSHVIQFVKASIGWSSRQGWNRFLEAVYGMRFEKRTHVSSRMIFSFCWFSSDNTFCLPMSFIQEKLWLVFIPGGWTAIEASLYDIACGMNFAVVDFSIHNPSLAGWKAPKIP